MFGVTPTAYLYVVDNYENSSKNGLDYAFPLYTGILMTSLLYFSIYCIVKKNDPEIHPRAILPGLSSGIMWGIATSSFYVVC
jgi:hypothetical protein